MVSALAKELAHLAVTLSSPERPNLCNLRNVVQCQSTKSLRDNLRRGGTSMPASETLHNSVPSRRNKIGRLPQGNFMRPVHS
jgi:hypothetical protein